jgi:CMP-N-acetylneuraminic acid synthetase
LIARCVDTATRARSLRRVFVSTDDLAIAAAARRAGAEVIARPIRLAGDTASSESVLLHALTLLRARGETLPDLLAFLQCTAPFMTSADIDGTITALLGGGADTAFAAARHHGFLWRSGSDGAFGVNHEKLRRARRQERIPEVVEAGSVYVMRTAGFLGARHRFFGKTVFYEIPAVRLLEIDAPDDLARARRLAALMARR